jgi:hypothetical protein
MVAKSMCLILLGNQLKSIFTRAAAELATVIYNHRFTRHDDPASGETFIPSVSQLGQRKRSTMGDRSPKSNQKKSAQKQGKNNAASAKAKAAVAAKQAAGKKK